MTKTWIVALSFLSLAACTAGAGGQSAEVTGDQADELATTGPVYKQGEQLRTTANLNLRSGPSVNASVLRVMPQGSTVTVRETSGANAWVAVRFNGFDGWAHTSYLAPVAQENNIGGYSAARGAKLAAKALREDGHPAGGYCALETSNSVEWSGVIPNGVTWARGNAIDISEHMAADSAYDAKVGFKRIFVGPNNIPEGSIIGWRRGQCGYSAKYGHIEISVDKTSTRACSDFCGYIAKSCGAPYVFMPTVL